MINLSNQKTRYADEEMDLVTIAKNLWSNKSLITYTTISVLILSFFIYALTPESWTASTYITRSSLYSLYKEVKPDDTLEKLQASSLENNLYNSIQNDMFYTAMGIMAAKSISLKETEPKTSTYEKNLIYLAAATAKTKELAEKRLQSALDSANEEAVLLNLPNIDHDSNIKAFNPLHELQITNNKSLVSFSAIGLIFGFLLGCFFVHLRLLVSKHESDSKP
ncbi:hypothetical protein GIW50_03010 [Pseudomonas syringae]|uniref:Polysaccharide chain length determinant N-terminal domain-containing protein n=1 Tax=Pseudomonas syringae TaxID=317 RepID=A0A9Q3X0H1_PSESX|nr:hypothetical protein [Pseudomonas syringae]MCF5061993.1 hypothetical protein [Pseudomonas syringae]MCF5072970.1 hypothetical protein [Pseudomonas syringae]MCF5117378.1 hypothetical protein [Pseudomonas syringae]MCF5378879.1 hypothetical protein [Pseudomonas syringae]